MNPKQFLQIGGAVLVLVGALGFVGIFGPTAEMSIFGEAWWFGNVENWVHAVFGIIALAAAFVLPVEAQRPLVIAVGILAVFVGVYNIFSLELLGANLESPADMILHLSVGAWALWAAFQKESSAPMV